MATVANNRNPKNEPIQRLLKFLVVQTHTDLHDPSYSPLGKTRLDLGQRPMKLGKKATDPGNSRQLGHPALKIDANPDFVPLRHDPGSHGPQGP